MKTMKPLLSAATFEALSHVAGVAKFADTTTVDCDVLRVIAMDYFGHRNGYRPTQVPMSNISELDFNAPEQFQAAINALFHGVGVEGWDGLLSGGRKTIQLPNGESVYLPMPAVMKGFITEEIKEDDDGSMYTCYFITDAATGFMSLLRSVLVHYATGGTDWALTACSYNERLTSSLFRGGKADAYTVKGRTLAIAAVPGVKMNEVFASHLSVRGVAKHGDIVDYSKAPVLFDKAVKGLKLITRLPAEYFPNLRKDDMFNYALRNFGGVHHDYVTSCQDDADGDLLQLTNSGGAIPLHDGTHKAEMDQFITEYRDGELDMKEVDGVRTYCHLKAKAYKAYSAEDITTAVVESVNAKRSVGLYTDSAMKMSYALSADKRMFDVMTFEEGRLIRNALAIAIQIMSMKAIKHANGLAAESNLMYNKMCPYFSSKTMDYETPQTLPLALAELREFIDNNMNGVDAKLVDSAMHKLEAVLIPLSGSEAGDPSIADIAFSHRTMSSQLGNLEMVYCEKSRAFRGTIIDQIRAMFS